MSNYVNITASVGKNGKNKIEDIFPIQMLLNKFIIPGCLKPRTFIQQDGIIGQKTIDAIKDFQRRIVGFQNPDGRIDPGGKTLAALNGPLVWAKASTSSEEKTRDWAIALGAIKTGMFEFKLVNRATGEAKTLSIRNPIITAISINKSFTEKWVTFKTFLSAGFDDFDNQSTSISQSWQANQPYIMKIGPIGPVPVVPCPAEMFKSICPTGWSQHELGKDFWGNSAMGCFPDSKVSKQLGNASIGSAHLGIMAGIPQGPTPFPVPSAYPNKLWVPPSQMNALLLAP